MKTLRFYLFIAAIVLNACAGPNAGSNALLGPDAALRPHVAFKDFVWVSQTGAAGQIARVRCPSGYRLAGGGSSSVDGSAVGIGWGKPATNTWLVQPGSSGAQAIAIASCISNRVPSNVIKWYLHPSGGGIASVQCPVGYVLITGFARKTSKGQNATKTYVQGDAFFVAGGESAGASCGRGSSGIASFPKWNASLNPKEVFSPCPSGFSVIGGNTGTSQWPGPPVQQHRGTSTPGVVGSAGWWVFAGGENVVSFAVCVPGGT